MAQRRFNPSGEEFSSGSDFFGEFAARESDGMKFCCDKGRCYDIAAAWNRTSPFELMQTKGEASNGNATMFAAIRPNRY
jgi:hypothetical protein